MEKKQEKKEIKKEKSKKKTDKEIIVDLTETLQRLQADIISPLNDEERTSIVSARFPGKISAEIVQSLAEANIVVSPRHDFMRFSPHLYNSSDDIERALAELERILNI